MDKKIIVWQKLLKLIAGQVHMLPETSSNNIMEIVKDMEVYREQTDNLPERVVSVIWFGTTGIVKVKNEYDTRWYIGTGFGVDEKQDVEFIRDMGRPFILPPNFMSE